MDDLVTTFGLEASAVGLLTSAVQLGFIVGTLVFAILTIADRYSPSIVFMASAFSGALFNAAIIWEGHQLESILLFRFLTGFFLAGIYPVGMKIAADYYEKGLGKSLGFLVGALVLGTAFPHLLKDLSGSLPWKAVILITSSLAVLGGMLMKILVPDGPYRSPGQGSDLAACVNVFRQRDFRAAAIGYFGHMWELYAFWAFVPVMLSTYNLAHPTAEINVPLMSFLIIAAGTPSCIIAGHITQRVNTKSIATFALGLSAICCLLSPLMFSLSSELFFIGFLVFWGIVVIADSPMFSALVAFHAPAALTGTALTIVNCIGFALTIVSIQLLSGLQHYVPSPYTYLVLAIGPLLGLLVLNWKRKRSVSSFR